MPVIAGEYETTRCLFGGGIGLMIGRWPRRGLTVCLDALIAVGRPIACLGRKDATSDPAAGARCGQFALQGSEFRSNSDPWSLTGGRRPPMMGHRWDHFGRFVQRVDRAADPLYGKASRLPLFELSKDVRSVPDERAAPRYESFFLQSPN